jgi:pimeloyl-[acyl-carrier protein] methyl ester esterase
MSVMTAQKHFYLIRGLIREAAHWGDFLDYLKKGYPEAKITTIDIPGAGEYFRSTSPLSITGMVEQMRKVFKTHSLPEEENILIAISLGGMIAANWMQAHPEDFARCVLINTSYRDYSPVYERLKPQALAYLLKVPTLKGRAKEAHILKLVSNNTDRFESTLNLWEKVQEQRPVSLKNTIRQLLAAARFKSNGFKPKIPTLILAASADRMVSVECSEKIANAWGVPIMIHPTGGHDLSADDPQWIVEKIKEAGF